MLYIEPESQANSQNMAGPNRDVNVAKKLLDNLQTDLRSLSAEAKKKHPNIKETSEKIQLKLRTISAKNEEIIAGLIPASAEIVQPFVMGCDTRHPKMMPLCLGAVQRLISHEAISMTAADSIISMLWNLMEAGLEELKVLQTAIILITTNSVVQHESLAKALVLCFRLHFTKDSTTINTAAATIKQLVSIVFERVLSEDRVKSQAPMEPINFEELKSGSKTPPHSLQPCGGDAYLLFQDLCQLVNADQPFWLMGMTEMTRTFGLELLEAILTAFPEIFHTHSEFSFLLKERVCPLIIKLFSPSLKYRQGLPAPPSPAPVEKPFYPIVMRLLRIVSSLIKKYYSLLTTECEIFLSLLVKFLDPEKPGWQRCLALEVLHKLSIQPPLIRSFCESYDMKQHSTKIFRDIVNGLGSYIQSQFMSSSTGQSSQSGNKAPDTQGTPPALVGGMPVGGGVTPQPAFMYRGVWIPLAIAIPQGQTKPILLELLDRIEPPGIQEGYGMSLAFYSLLELDRSVQFIIAGETEDTSPVKNNVKTKRQLTEQERLLQEELINSSWCGMLAALSLLLDASTDESATEAILKGLQAYANLCGQLDMTTPRDAFITALCKASLPPHYTLTVLNSQSIAQSAQKGLQRSSSPDLQTLGSEAMERSQVVAVGSPLPTASLPVGAHQGPVMLTAKNIQCMRSLLAVAHCHGDILGTAWHLVLTTLQHLVWILGLKPSSGGTLKASQNTTESSNAVITTAVMADLPVLSAMLSRLFESSQYLDDVALHHLIDALCKLSAESMELAFSNREPSLFAVAKLLETGLVNLARVEVLWKPVTAHLLEVCQHPHNGMRCWGAEAVTSLVKAALNHPYNPPLHQNLKLQTCILGPLQELSVIHQPDIRQRQLECVLQILHSNGDKLVHGWPLVLGVIGAVTNDQGEKLVQTAFQSLQLVVADFLPIIPCVYLQVCVDVAAKFGLQHQELNISLTSIGLLWNISDFFYQNREKIAQELESDLSESDRKKLGMPAFDSLWMCLYTKLGQLCVDQRPAIRKSAGQTLFSMITAHGSLLHKDTWQKVLWQVLFPLLADVQRLSSQASNVKDEAATGNILIHHSRDTAEKQWAETRVLTLAGVARTFNSKRKFLQPIGDFPRAWSLLLEYVETASLCQNAEVSLAALKSFQEVLQISKDKPEDQKYLEVFPQMTPPSEEVMHRSDVKKSNEQMQANKPSDTDMEYDLSLWTAAWKVWLNIGTNATKPPTVTNKSAKVYVPSQAFLTALIQTFPYLFEHIKSRFITADLQKLSSVLQTALSVPVHGDASPFIIPSYPDITVTPLQEAVLQAMDVLIKQAVQNGQEPMQSMYPDIYHQLLTYVEYGVKLPKYGQIEAKAFGTVKGPQVDWVTMNFVPFSEKCVEMVVDLYRVTAKHSAVINGHILEHIIKAFRLPLSYKYSCPSPTTWMLVINSLLSILSIGLPVARKHESSFKGMWPELAQTLEDFLFSKSPSLPTLSVEDFQRDETIDCKVVQLIRDDILPHACSMPPDFVKKIMQLLNKGSIHATPSDTFIDTDSSRKLREEFAKTCFETLLQFSFISKSQSEEGSITKVAVLSLLQRCQDVVKKYVEDERLSGKCPLPRPRLAEMASVLKAITTLISSLKKAPHGNVERSVWNQVIQLYPSLVDCITSPSPSVCKALKDVLHEYKDLLSPLNPTTQNGTV